MKKISILVFLFHASILIATAQESSRPVTLTGFIFDQEQDSPLPGVNIIVQSVQDSTVQYGTISNEQGYFRFNIPQPGIYRIKMSFVGFAASEIQKELVPGRNMLGRLEMEQQTIGLDQVVIEGVQERVIQQGDTTVYNADAFKVNQDANAEDLIAKMPGIVVDEGSVQAQGETVQRVLVDGREFFGNDPQAALQTLPAEVIEKIEVFDRMSDQAQFTGFDDGNSEKTINIVTRPGMSNGQFGKLFGGYGSDTRYSTGGNINIFNDDQRISFIGLSNNVNQQNFTTEDLLGVVGNVRNRGGGGFGGGRGGAGGGRGIGGRPGGGGIGGMLRQGNRPLQSDPSNFLVGNQGGINQTNSIGLNYSDSWGEKLEMTGSYFFNSSNNQSDVFLEREYYLDDTVSQLYDETDQSEGDNYNHRANMRMRYRIDESNSLVFTPRISFQRNEAISSVFGINTLLNGSDLSTTTNNYTSENTGYNASSNLLFQHRFSKPRRTVSTNISLSYNNKDGESDLLSTNQFFDDTNDFLTLDQRTNSDQSTRRLGTSIAYTEPVGGMGMLMINYSPSLSWSDADQRTNSLDAASGDYSLLETALSNVFESTTVQHRAGVNYMKRSPSGMLSFGFDVQKETLTGEQVFPQTFNVERTFDSFLPRAMYMLRFSRSHNLRLFYRTRTSTPSIAQLQNVIDNSNPLQLSSGNPDLKQSYSHMLIARYNRTQAETGRVFVGFASISQTQNHIGSSSLIALSDTTIAPGVVLAQGSQFTQPLNVDGYWNARSFFTLGVPSELLRSNINMNAGYSFSRSPGTVNGISNTALSHSITGGIVIGSNISERVDFTLSYTGNLVEVTNSAFPELNSDYMYHKGSGKLNVTLGNSWVVDSQLSVIQYTGLGEAFDSNNLVWNAGLGYRLLRGNGGQISLRVVDLLNQNNSISRTINEFYVEDNASNVLGRYILLNFTYNLRHFTL